MSIKKVSPLASCFVRAFIEQLTTTPAPNRQVQEQALAGVVELGGAISPAYIRKLFKQMEAEGLFGYGPKNGKARTLIANQNTLDFQAWLAENMDYGLSPNKEESMEEFVVRSKMIDQIKDEMGVVIDVQNHVPKVAFRYLMEKFNKGELQMVFMHPDLQPIGVDDQDNEHEFNHFPGASVGDE